MDKPNINLISNKLNAANRTFYSRLTATHSIVKSFKSPTVLAAGMLIEPLFKLRASGSATASYNDFVVPKIATQDFSARDIVDRIYGSPYQDIFVERSHGQAITPVSPVKEDLPMHLRCIFSPLSSALGAVCVYPLDKAKTRVQNSAKKASLFNVLHKMSSEGLVSFYRGLGPQLIGITPEKTIKLVAYDLISNAMRGKDGSRLTIPHEMLAGALIGVIQIAITTPYELVKIRFQTQTDKKTRVGALAIMQNLGLRGMYRGIGATAMRDIPFNIIYFSLNAFIKNTIKDKSGRELKFWEFYAASCFAASLAAFIDTPADCLKTRLQSSRYNYNGVSHAFTSVVKTEGVRALFKGAHIRVAMISPLFGITFGTYETLKQFYLNHQKKKNIA